MNACNPCAWVVVCALVSAACTHQRPPLPDLQEVTYDAHTQIDEPVVVPLIESELPIIEVDIAGCGRARFLVDSAMELTMIDREFAGRCGLPLRSFAFELNVRTAGGRLQRIEQAAHIEKLSIGSASATGLDAPLTDLKSLPFQLDGVLGQDVIGDWALLFLDARRELVILPSEGLLKSLSAFIESGTPLESMEIGGVDRIPIMPLHLMDADKTVDLHVDTGSTHTALPLHALNALGVNAGTATESTTLAGKETRRAWKVLGFPLGNQRVDLTIRDTGGETGLLGYDALRQRIFVLDGPGQRLLIEAPATAR